MIDAYADFVRNKSQLDGKFGFKSTFQHPMAYDFQSALVDWAVEQGRSAIFADCGLGKGQPADSKVLTPSGWRRIGDLASGDAIINSSGSASRVTGVYPKPEQDTFRFWYSDGASLVVDSDHLHICRTNNDRQRGAPWRVLSTLDLLTCGNLRYGKEGKSRNYDIPVVDDVLFNPTHLPINPYVVGALLGDGHFGARVCLSSADAEVIDRVAVGLPNGVTLNHIDGYDWSIKTGLAGSKRHPFNQIWADLGLAGSRSHDKRVPEEYLFSSPADRLELLRGLMDTDGYASPDGCCQFYSVSERLTDDVIHLVRSLGGVPTKSQKTPHCDGKPGRICYVATFSLATHNPFYLKRKADRWNCAPRDNGRWIDRIEPDARQPTVCISVDSADSSYVTENFIVTHNTLMQMTWAHNVNVETNKSVLIIAPLMVSMQTQEEAEKFSFDATRSGDGKFAGSARIITTNYERLHYFDPADFAGVVCDESSIIKNFDGARKGEITEFMKQVRYRLLCSATPSPNDYIELGTSSEAIGQLGHMDMLGMFFKNDEDSLHPAFIGSKWRFKYHAEADFWRWVCSWARAIRKPSDIGFDDRDFVLPPLIETEHVLTSPVLEGNLFAMPTANLLEERQERRDTIVGRCERAAELLADAESGVAWCQLNKEAEALVRMIPGAVEIKGGDEDDYRQEVIKGFKSGQIKKIVTKPKIASQGLNFQHCNTMTYFADHSYEAYYQAVRRFWRFGQQRPVTSHVITTESLAGVTKNLRRKAEATDAMFETMIRQMGDAMELKRFREHHSDLQLPAWL